jgi:3-deoxy-manno-octulosonate cytidylyltransferase (CMP-KDO synthetase)
MKVLGIIPSRFESSRFPGKPLIDIQGKSMIQRVYEQASKSKHLDEIIVATDDQRIFNHVEEFGGNVAMTKSSHRNGTERCGEIIQQFSDIDVVVNIQGDEPLVEPEQLDKLINLFIDQTVQIGTLVKKISSVEEIKNPNRIKVVLDKNNNALYFSRNIIPYSNVPHVAYKHIGIYAWRHQTLLELLELSPTELEIAESLEQLRWLENGYKIRTAETMIETPNIDTPEDLEAVLKMLNL